MKWIGDMLNNIRNIFMFTKTVKSDRMWGTFDYINIEFAGFSSGSSHNIRITGEEFESEESK